MIIIENATKKFGTQTVLNNVSLTLEDGKIYGFVGQNGCGKTVLFKSICGFIYLDRGTITVDGKVIGKDIDIIKDAGIIIESPGFLPNYSAFKNLKFLTMIKDNIGDEQIKSTLISVGLDPESKKVVGKFSLGMRQRLGIAQAIMENPLGNPLYPIERILLSLLTIHAPTWVFGSLERSADILATPIKYSSHEI